MQIKLNKLIDKTPSTNKVLKKHIPFAPYQTVPFKWENVILFISFKSNIKNKYISYQSKLIL